MKTLLSTLALLGSVAFLGGCYSSQRAYPAAPPTSGTTYAPSSGGTTGGYQPAQPTGPSAPAPAAPGTGGGQACGAGGKACGK